MKNLTRPGRRSFSVGGSKNFGRHLAAALLGILCGAACCILSGGCKTGIGVSLSGSYGIGGTNFTGTVKTTTNSVTVGGTYTTPGTNAGGSVTVTNL